MHQFRMVHKYASKAQEIRKEMQMRVPFIDIKRDTFISKENKGLNSVLNDWILKMKTLNVIKMNTAFASKDLDKEINQISYYKKVEIESFNRYDFIENESNSFIDFLEQPLLCTWKQDSICKILIDKNLTDIPVPKIQTKKNNSFSESLSKRSVIIKEKENECSDLPFDLETPVLPPFSVLNLLSFVMGALFSRDTKYLDSPKLFNKFAVDSKLVIIKPERINLKLDPIKLDFYDIKDYELEDIYLRKNDYTSLMLLELLQKFAFH